MDANDVLYEIARTFYGTDHEDYLRLDDGELRLGNLTVVARGDRLEWRDLGLPRNAGSTEIPEGSDYDEELPDGSYIEDIVDEVGQWLLGWTEAIDAGELLEYLQDVTDGEIVGDALIENDGVTAWSVATYDEAPFVLLGRGSVAYGKDDIVEDDFYPVDPELAATGHGRKAVEEAYRGLIKEAGL